MQTSTAHGERDTATDAGFLRACDAVYRSLRGRLQHLDWTRQPNSGVALTRAVANFATTNHTGRFADGTLDSLLLEIGSRHVEGLIGGGSVRASSGRRAILHVVSLVLPVGGHTKMLANWVTADRQSDHHVVVIDQGHRPVPPLVSNLRTLEGASVTVLEGSPLGRAARLRQLARSMDLVILHQDLDDPVPTLAFATPDCPPVGYVNFADHLFWIGSSVADAVLSLRQAGAFLNRERRLLRAEVSLPIPVPEPGARIERGDARTRLGLSDSTTVFLSLGRALKYHPTRTQDFFRSANAILEATPDSILYVVGVGEHEHNGTRHPRLRLVGTIDDPSAYQVAADVYLEGYPIGSQTALLEAALTGMPVVRAPAPMCPLLVAQDAAIDGLADNPATEAEYVSQATRLARSQTKSRTLGAELSRRVRALHVGDAWLEQLHAAYASLSRLPHAPTPLPATSAWESPTDLAISYWQALGYGKPLGRQDCERLLRDQMYGAAYWTRKSGDSHAARTLLTSGAAIGGWSPRMCVEAVKTIVDAGFDRLGGSRVHA